MDQLPKTISNPNSNSSTSTHIILNGRDSICNSGHKKQRKILLLLKIKVYLGNWALMRGEWGPWQRQQRKKGKRKSRAVTIFLFLFSFSLWWCFNRFCLLRAVLSLLTPMKNSNLALPSETVQIPSSGPSFPKLKTKPKIQNKINNWTN